MQCLIIDRSRTASMEPALRRSDEAKRTLEAEQEDVARFSVHGSILSRGSLYLGALGKLLVQYVRPRASSTTIGSHRGWNISCQVAEMPA